MGAYLSTDIVSPKVVAAGGQLTGNFVTKSPSVGYFYGMIEQYTSALALIPGSRAYLYRAVAGGPFVNSTVNYTVLAAAAVGEEETIPVVLTLPNTDCYLYVFLKQISTVVTAGSLVVGAMYRILTLGTTDFTLVGASSNTVGVAFVATGPGTGTGTVLCTTPNPDTDDTIDYVVITLQSSAGGLNVSELMSLMVTMMIVVMMMKMMAQTVKGIKA